MIRDRGRQKHSDSEQEIIQWKKNTFLSKAKSFGHKFGLPLVETTPTCWGWVNLKVWGTLWCPTFSAALPAWQFFSIKSQLDSGFSFTSGSFPKYCKVLLSKASLKLLFKSELNIAKFLLSPVFLSLALVKTSVQPCLTGKICSKPNRLLLRSTWKMQVAWMGQYKWLMWSPRHQASFDAPQSVRTAAAKHRNPCKAVTCPLCSAQRALCASSLNNKTFLQNYSEMKKIAQWSSRWFEKRPKHSDQKHSDWNTVTISQWLKYKVDAQIINFNEEKILFSSLRIHLILHKLSVHWNLSSHCT